MSFIQSYGIALPQFRIEDSILHQKGKKGVMKSVCYSDEDIITLAFEAATNCLENFKSKIDGIFFVTTTPVFQHRYHSSFLADLLGISANILCLDFCSSSRSGTDAMLIADKLINSGSFSTILVVSSDAYFSPIGEEISTPFGHAACAILLNKENGFAEITSSASYGSSISEEFIFKNNKIQLDPRYSRDAGFKTNLSIVLNKTVSQPLKYDSVILNSLYSKIAGNIFLKSGFELQQFSKDAIINKTGFTSSSHSLLQLIYDLENNKKYILFIAYGNGTNIFEITKNSISKEKPFTDKLQIFECIESYQDYLLLRKAGNFNSLSYKPKEIFSSEMMNEREKSSLIYLHAQQCLSCGTKYILNQLVCKKCKSAEFKNVQLSKTGTVYSFTNEHYFPTTFPPLTMAVIDLDGGGRVTLQQTDKINPLNCKIDIGCRVKLVFRKMIENDIKPNYFWKFIIE